MNIRFLRAADEADWRRLWDSYNAFYGQVIAPEVTDHLWRCIRSESHHQLGLVATIGDRLAGFAHVIAHPVTWAIGKAGYLEDLFVAPDCRQQGIAHALIEEVLEIGRRDGWSRVYWHTLADNFTARRVYDSFTPPDDVVRYRLFLG